MAYNHVEIKKFVGLYLQQNTFTVPDGAMEVANNCVLARDFIIQKRPGFPTLLDPSTGTLNNLQVYNGDLIAKYDDKIEKIDTSGGQTLLTGESFDASGRVARSAKDNKNLYVTSNNGVMKLTSSTSQITTSGIAPALDLQGSFLDLDITGTSDLGPIAGDSQVAYRVVFGKRDDNDNLLLGSPSDILVLVNPAQSATYTFTGSGPYTITVTTLGNHNLQTGMFVTIKNATPTGDINGSRQITVTGPTTFTYTYDGAAPTNGTLEVSYNKTPRLEFTIPDEIQNAVDASEYFYQVYRTTTSGSAADTPTPDFSLAKEAEPTAAELASRVVIFDDTVDQLFLEGAAELYTNPNSREGELQENSRPPLCEDIALFKEHLFYANATYRHLLELQLISSNITSSIIDEDDYVEIKQGATERRYVARKGVGNSNVQAESVGVVGAGPYTVTITYTAHRLKNGDTIRITWDDVTGATMVGEHVVSNVAANTFDISVATDPATVNFLQFEGIKDANDYYIFQLLDSATNLSAGLYASSVGLVRAINRDDSSPVIARYISGVEDLPGEMFLESKTYATDPIQLRAISAGSSTPGQAFDPPLTSAYADTESTQDIQPNVLAVSKIGEPEAVPRINQLVVGAANSAILRVFALRDSLLVLKEEGVFRVDGDTVNSFNVTIVDNTVFCVAPNSAALLNNQVIFLSNQGVVLATATSVEIISRQGIEDPVQVILGDASLAASTSGVAHESERLYLLSTLIPNSGGARRVYCWNFLTSGWTTWDVTFEQGVVGPGDALHLISTDNTIRRQRKQQNRLDYVDESYAITVDTVAGDASYAEITSASYIPKFGDIIVENGVINRIITVASLGSNQYRLTFDTDTNLVVGANTIYEAYQSDIKMVPFHGGLVNREKHYPQFQVHTRNRALTALDVTFSNDTYGSSELTEWRESNVTVSGGWGNEPWGLFGWGQENGINLTFGTQPSTVIRLYVPRFAARSSFIQATLCHRIGGEPMNIQAMGYQVRAYKERVTR